MAYVGMRHPVWAPIESHVHGSAIVYGEGMVLGKAVGADVELQRADVALYAEDGKAESDNSVTGGTIRVETDDVMHEVAAKVWGLKVRTVGEKKVYTTTGKSAPYGCCGWVDVRKNEGVESFVVNFAHKVQLGRSRKTSATKGQTLTYQTTEQNGNLMGVQIDESMEDYYLDEIPVATVQEAITLLDTMANVPKTESQKVEEGA